MLVKISFYFFTFLFFCVSNTPFIQSAKSQNNDNKLNEIVDYLKGNLPNYNYILGPGDGLRIVVARVSWTESISNNWWWKTINLLKIGRLYVKDLSINELNELLSQAYKKYVKYPAIGIEIENYRPIKVLVEGGF